jgi:uncharacterized iron-regulated membrane protein
MKRRRTRFFMGVVLAFAVAAFTASAAQGQPVAKLTPQQLAEQLRFQGVDKRDGLTGQKTSRVQSSGVVATKLTPQQLAEQLRFQGIDKRTGLTGRKTGNVQSSSLAASSNDGFSWGNAFVGAAAVAAITIILMGGYVITRRRQHALAS